MKNKHPLITVIFLVTGCALFRIGENESIDSGKKIEKYADGTKKSETNPVKGTYTEWYDNGQIRFRASKWVGERELSWLPEGKNGRIVERIILAPGLLASYAFIYDEQHQSQIPWGAYNSYEGWYSNGQKKFIYEYVSKQFTEWDINGRIIEKRKQ